MSGASADNDGSPDEIYTVKYHHIPDSHLLKVQGANVTDNEMQLLSQIIMSGWPQHKREVPIEMRTYFDYCDELTLQDGIVCRGDRIVIPWGIRLEMKQKVLTGHLGINSCIRGARDVMFWPGMNAEIRTYIESCDTCSTYGTKQPAEFPIISEQPGRAWYKVATDLFSF